MSNDNLRAAITAALKRRDPNADLDVSPTCTPLGAWVSLAGGVIRGPDGAVIDMVARASDDAKALRGVAFAIGLREDGGDPAEEVERLTRELADARATIDRLLGVIGAHGGEVARLQFACESEATRHEKTRAAVREYFASESAVSCALADDTDASDPVAMLTRMHAVRTRRDEALARLRALVPS